MRLTGDWEDADGVLAVDASSLAWYAYHAGGNSTRVTFGGGLTGHVEGALEQLLRVLVEQSGEKAWFISTCVDGAGADAHRRTLLPSYKTNRDHPWTPVPDVVSVLRHLPGEVCEEDTLEADDQVVAAVDRARRAGKEALVLSADSDLWHLLPSARVWMPPTSTRKVGRLADLADVLQKFKVRMPDRIPLVKAVLGDVGDVIKPCYPRLTRARWQALLDSDVMSGFGRPTAQDLLDVLSCAQARVLVGGQGDLVLMAPAALRANWSVVAPIQPTLPPSPSGGDLVGALLEFGIAFPPVSLKILLGEMR